MMMMVVLGDHDHDHDDGGDGGVDAEMTCRRGRETVHWAPLLSLPWNNFSGDIANVVHA